MNILVGFALFGVGAANFVMGRRAEHVLSAAGAGKLAPARAREEFEKADVDGNLTLDSAELATLMASLGVTMSRQQLEVALVEMDTDGDGTISWGEFLQWSQGSDHADEAWDTYVSGDGGYSEERGGWSREQASLRASLLPQDSLA